MNVGEVMASVVRSVRPADPLYRAARMMQEFDVGCVLVCDGRTVSGIVTDRDLVIRGLAGHAAPAGMVVADVMTPEPVCCSVDDTVRQAAAIMASHQVRRLPVLDFEQRLCGIVSIGDICTHAPSDMGGDLIGKISESGHSYLVETA